MAGGIILIAIGFGIEIGNGFSKTFDSDPDSDPDALQGAEEGNDGGTAVCIQQEKQKTARTEYYERS